MSRFLCFATPVLFESEKSTQVKSQHTWKRCSSWSAYDWTATPIFTNPLAHRGARTVPCRNLCRPDVCVTYCGEAHRQQFAVARTRVGCIARPQDVIVVRDSGVFHRQQFGATKRAVKLMTCGIWHAAFVHNIEPSACKNSIVLTVSGQNVRRQQLRISCMLRGRNLRRVGYAVANHADLAPKFRAKTCHIYMREKLALRAATTVA